jgi:hypothetical protein
MLLPATIVSIDTLITNLANQLATLQPAYLASKARYWQGASTHSIIPIEGVPTAPNLLAKPTDQTESWLTFGIVLPALTEAALSVEIYNGPSGHGYVIHADVISSGVRFRKSTNIGPESWRTHSWLTFKVAPMT